jgi:sugar/nucleoside kinase (ribokinase family)
MAGLVHAHLADLPIEEAVRFALSAAVVTAASASPVATDFSAEIIHANIKKEAS